MRDLLHELMETASVLRERQSEGLAVYRPLPFQEAFHRDPAHERLIRGGNQSGKSQALFVEIASAATGIPITTASGEQLPRKYPDRPLIIWIIGYDLNHIGGTVYRKLFTNQDSQWIIDDEETGLPRAWNPENESDQARVEMRRNAGPLIPERLIDPTGWSWHDKGTRAFAVCRLLNGTEIRAYSSGGQIAQGISVDILAIDEDIEHPEYYPDWRVRLTKRNGYLMWAAFPWSRNNQLNILSQRAEQAADDPNADIREYRPRFSQNTWLGKKERQSTLESWKAQGAGVLAAREAGEFLLDNVLMYPQFDKDIHGIDLKRCPDCEAARIIQSRNGIPPDNWMRLLALDPGSQRQAVLFAAVPPPDIGDNVVFYDEVFLVNSDAANLATEVLQRTKGWSFSLFLMDMHAGKHTAMGFGRTVHDNYVSEFRKKGIVSERGLMFQWGNDNVEYRAQCVRDGLRVREDGPPRFLFWLPRMERALFEFQAYKRQLRQDEYQDKPIPVHNDVMNCLEYLSATGLVYAEPRQDAKESLLQQWQRTKEWLFPDSSRKRKQGFDLGAPV